MVRIKNPKQKLLITAAVLLFAVLLYLSPISCPFLAVTGVRCFGCGMTRALLSALRLDFAAAFSYHFMFPSVPLLYLCFLKDGKLFKNKTLNIVFYVIIILGFVINWIRGFFV